MKGRGEEGLKGWGVHTAAGIRAEAWGERAGSLTCCMSSPTVEDRLLGCFGTGNPSARAIMISRSILVKLFPLLCFFQEGNVADFRKGFQLTGIRSTFDGVE